MNSNAFSDRLVTPMDTAARVSPLERREEQWYRPRVKSWEENELGRGVTQGEEKRWRGRRSRGL